MSESPLDPDDVPAPDITAVDAVWDAIFDLLITGTAELADGTTVQLEWGTDAGN